MYDIDSVYARADLEAVRRRKARAGTYKLTYLGIYMPSTYPGICTYLP